MRNIKIDIVSDMVCPWRVIAAELRAEESRYAGVGSHPVWPYVIDRRLLVAGPRESDIVVRAFNQMGALCRRTGAGG